MSETMHVIEELSQLGYTHRIATNEGTLLYQAQQKIHPDLFQHLEGGMTVHYINNPEVKKPDIRYFNEYQRRYNPAKEKIIIFIDDNPNNVLAAQQAEMIGITFTGPNRLRNDLRSLGIPLSPASTYHGAPVNQRDSQ